jgi:serine/threonine-protein kinase RsbW
MADASQTANLSIPNEPAAIDAAQASVVATLEQLGYPKASLFAVRLALHEALSNALTHGHRNLPSAPVTLSYSIDAKRAEFTIEDQGPGFDPSSVPDPTLDENLERGCGRGLLLIRAYMTSAEYKGRGNVLHMVYRRPAGA